MKFNFHPAYTEAGRFQCFCMCLSGSWLVVAEELEDHHRLGLFWSCVGLADSIMSFESIKKMCVPCAQKSAMDGGHNKLVPL